MPTAGFWPESTVSNGWSYSGPSLHESINQASYAANCNSTTRVDYLCEIPNLPAAATSIVGTPTGYWYVQRGGAQTPYLRYKTTSPTTNGGPRGPLSWTWYAETISGTWTVAVANACRIGAYSDSNNQPDSYVGQQYIMITYKVPAAAVVAMLFELLPPILFGPLATLTARELLEVRAMLASRVWVPNRPTVLSASEFRQLERGCREHRDRTHHLAPAGGWALAGA